MARVGIYRWTVRTDERGIICEELSSVRKVREVHVGDYWVPIT